MIMPTASDELRNFATTNFDTIDAVPIVAFLQRQGFVHTKEFCWKRKLPPTHFEWNCINFLIEEWDFGGYDED